MWAMVGQWGWWEPTPTHGQRSAPPWQPPGHPCQPLPASLPPPCLHSLFSSAHPPHPMGVRVVPDVFGVEESSHAIRWVWFQLVKALPPPPTHLLGCPKSKHIRNPDPTGGGAWGGHGEQKSPCIQPDLSDRFRATNGASPQGGLGRPQQGPWCPPARGLEAMPVVGWRFWAKMKYSLGPLCKGSRWLRLWTHLAAQFLQLGYRILNPAHQGQP